MSIASQAARIISAKEDIRTAVASKGVNIPSSAKIDQYPSYVDAIQQGGGTPVSHPAPSISFNPSTGLITATHTQAAGVVSAGTTTDTLQLGTLGAQTITPMATAQTIPADVYLTGVQTIAGDANLVAGNIKSGVSIFGVVGTYETPSQSKTFTPTAAGSTIVPDAGYLLSQVAVSGDANLVAGNIKSDVTIFGVTGTYGGGGGGGNNYMAEYLNGTLSAVYDSQATQIGVSGFLLYAQALKSVEMTAISQITSNSAFAFCTELEYLSMPVVTSIMQASTSPNTASKCFYSCTKIKSVYMPLLKSAPTGFLLGCSGLSSAVFTSLEVAAAQAFDNCQALPSLDLPNLLSIYNNTFRSCYALSVLSTPNLTMINGAAGEV